MSPNNGFGVVPVKKRGYSEQRVNVIYFVLHSDWYEQ